MENKTEPPKKNVKRTNTTTKRQTRKTNNTSKTRAKKGSKTNKSTPKKVISNEIKEVVNNYTQKVIKAVNNNLPKVKGMVNSNIQKVKNISKEDVKETLNNQKNKIENLTDKHPYLTTAGFGGATIICAMFANPVLTTLAVASSLSVAYIAARSSKPNKIVPLGILTCCAAGYLIQPDTKNNTNQMPQKAPIIDISNTNTTVSPAELKPTQYILPHEEKTVTATEARYCAALFKMIQFCPDKPINDVIQMYTELANTQNPDIAKEIALYGAKYQKINQTANNPEDFKSYLQFKAAKSPEATKFAIMMTEPRYCAGLLKLMELCPEYGTAKAIHIYTELESFQNPEYASEIRAFGKKYQNINEALNNQQEFTSYLRTKMQSKNHSQLKVSMQHTTPIKGCYFALTRERA